MWLITTRLSTPSGIRAGSMSTASYRPISPIQPRASIRWMFRAAAAGSTDRASTEL